MLIKTLWFGLSGSIGFIVDAGMLHILSPQLGLHWGRVFSFLCAVATTWVLNRVTTFRDRKSHHGAANELMLYLLLMLGGGAVNYLIYAFAITHSQTARDYPSLAVAAGSLFGMFVNFASARFLLFKHSK